MPQKKQQNKKKPKKEPKEKSLAELREEEIKRRLRSGILSKPHKPISKLDRPLLLMGRLY